MKNKAQVGRFAIVGSVNTALDFGLLFILSTIGLPHLVANTISTGIAFIFSFFANKRFTFRASGTNLRREIALFIIVTLFGLWVLQNLVIWAVSPLTTSFIKNADLSLLAAKILATGVSLVWNYLMYDRVVFRKENA